MGTVSPPLKRRRGIEGLYKQPRNILSSIPGVKFVEMPRTKENAYCCGAGRGAKEAFPELASFSAKHRLEEVREVGAEALVSACPWCKNNFAKAVKENGDNVKVMDISELILESVGV
jgi:Fe-S oxidoreductase